MLIFVEGIDKTGKDTLVRYINELTNYQHCVLTRGPISSIAYSRKYHRTSHDETYIKSLVDSSLVIFLTAELDDLDIRFKLTNEPEINKQEDLKLFIETKEYLENKYNLKCRMYNTTYHTPYEIALYIKEELLNEQK